MEWKQNKFIPENHEKSFMFLIWLRTKFSYKYQTVVLKITLTANAIAFPRNPRNTFNLMNCQHSNLQEMS